MAIVDMYLVDSSGSFDYDKKEITLEWWVFSDEILHHSLAITLLGMIEPHQPLIETDGKAKGWHPPGTPYRIGSTFRGGWRGEWNNTCYAGNIDVFDRQIIKGDGVFRIDAKNMEIVINHNTNRMIWWKVRQTYSTENESTIDTNDGIPSESDRWSISVAYEYEDVPFTEDVQTGRPVVNSVGMPFNPPPTRRVKIPVYSLTRREYGNPLYKALVFSNTIDGRYLIDSIATSFNGQVWTVTYHIKEREEGWLTYILDTGYHYRDPVTKKIHLITHEDGTPISEPIRLDGNGRPVPPGSDYCFNLGPFRKYKPSVLGALAIPNPHSIIAIPGVQWELPEINN